MLTDLEFYEMRYSGKAATFVRGFRAVYLGLFFNCVIMATVNLAAAKIANILLGWPMYRTLAFASVITIFFASVSGLWGVLVTDSIQFTVTMTGATPECRVETIGGDIAFDATRLGTSLAELQTHSGAIRIDVTALRAPTLDLSSRSGTVTQPRLTGAAANGRVIARSFKGAVMVTPLPGSKPR